jgi:hypothetical protein
MKKGENIIKLHDPIGMDDPRGNLTYPEDYAPAGSDAQGRSLGVNNEVSNPWEPGAHAVYSQDFGSTIYGGEPKVHDLAGMDTPGPGGYPEDVHAATGSQDQPNSTPVMTFDDLKRAGWKGNI